VLLLLLTCQCFCCFDFAACVALNLQEIWKVGSTIMEILMILGHLVQKLKEFKAIQRILV